MGYDFNFGDQVGKFIMIGRFFVFIALGAIEIKSDNQMLGEGVVAKSLGDRWEITPEMLEALQSADADAESIKPLSFGEERDEMIERIPVYGIVWRPLKPGAASFDKTYIGERIEPVDATTHVRFQIPEDTSTIDEFEQTMRSGLQRLFVMLRPLRAGADSLDDTHIEATQRETRRVRFAPLEDTETVESESVNGVVWRPARGDADSFNNVYVGEVRQEAEMEETQVIH